MRVAIPWTPEEVRLLRRLRAASLTAKEIAELCENTFGVKFPMFVKSRVVASAGGTLNPLFAELAQRIFLALLFFLLQRLDAAAVFVALEGGGDGGGDQRLQHHAACGLCERFPMCVGPGVPRRCVRHGRQR